MMEMEFKTDTYIPVIMGIMLTLILTVSVMIPVFAGIEDQIFEKNRNDGAIHYANLYEMDDPAITITIDEATDTATVGGVDMHLDSPTVIAASSTVQVVYNKLGTGNYPLHMMVYQGSNNTQDEWAYVDLERVILTTTNGSIAIQMTTFVGSDAIEKIFNGTGPIYYLDSTGPYGIFDHTALNSGVNVNGTRYLGVIVLGGDATGTTYGAVGTWRYIAHISTFHTEVFHPTNDMVEGAAFPTHETVPYSCDITGTYTDNDGYETLTISQMMIRTASAPIGSETVAYDGFFIICPIEYVVSVMEHGEIMWTILWLLPVMVVLGCMLLATQYMTDLGSGGGIITRREKPKER